MCAALALERAIRKAGNEEKATQASQSVHHHPVNDVDGCMNAQEDDVITQWETRAEATANQSNECMKLNHSSSQHLALFFADNFPSRLCYTSHSHRNVCVRANF